MLIDKHLITFSSYLLCLIPLSLLTGPFLPDLFVSIISLIFLFIVIKKKEWKYFFSKFFIVFLIFYLYLILTSLSSVYPLISLESSLFYFRFGLFSLAVWFLLDNNFKLMKLFTFTFLLTFCFAIFDGYYQYIYDESTFGYNSLSPTRMSLPLNDKMILGGYISRIFPFLFGLMIFLFPRSKLTVSITCLLLILADVLVYISGERTALGLLFISTVIIIFVISRYKFLRIITFILSIAIIIFITLSDSAIRHRNIDKTIDQMNLISEDSNSQIRLFSPVHESMFKSAFIMFKDNKLFGIGPKLYRIYCSDERYNINNDSCNTHPHNTYVQLAAETGMIGIVFVGLLFLFLTFKLFKHMYIKIFFREVSISDVNLCLIICFILSLWPFLPTQSFFNNWINIIYFLPVGFYLYLNNSIQKDMKVNKH